MTIAAVWPSLSGDFFSGENFVKGKVIAQTSKQTRVWYAFQSCPFLNGVRFSIIGNIVIASSVILLHDNSSPSAIIGRVWTVVVNAVNTVIGAGAWSHVCQKILEGVEPTITDEGIYL